MPTAVWNTVACMSCHAGWWGPGAPMFCPTCGRHTMPRGKPVKVIDMKETE